MTRRILLAALLLVVALPVSAQEFHVIASRRAVVRTSADINADAIVRLDRSDAAACVTDNQTEQPEQLDAFYHIRLTDGRTGWVSRFTVRAFEGPVPGALPTTGETTLDVLAAETHLAIGKPEGYVELVNEGYVVGYDPRLKIPAWVQYRLTRADIATDRPRSNAFEPDMRVPEPGRATLTDYEVAGSWDVWIALGLQPPAGSPPNYARGHMAPARDLTRTDEIERSSYLLTNMRPQIHNGYKNGIWSSLERRIRQWVEARGELTIIAGPVFLASARQLTPPAEEVDRLGQVDAVTVFAQPPTERQVIYNVVGDNEIAIPTAFFKVVIDTTNSGAPEAIAFLIEHVRDPNRSLEDTIVTIDRIEEVTGLDLLSNLRQDLEEAVESSRADELW